MGESKKMHPDEIDIDVALVRQLLRAQFAPWAELPIAPVLPRGTDNALYRVGEDMVARLPRRERPSRTLEKERHWLPRLASSLPVAVPLPLADGEPSDDYPYAWGIYRWLDGEPATLDKIDDLERFADDLADFLAALQRIDASGGPEPGDHNFFRGVPLERRDADTRASIAALAGAIDAVAATVAWEEALSAPEWTGPPVWIHGDLDAHNLLVANGRLTGVLDFGGLAVGDPACDVMVAWKVLTAETRSVFRAVLGVDDATWARGRGWALSQAVIALSYYTLETNSTLVREAERWLAAVLGG